MSYTEFTGQLDTEPAGFAPFTGTLDGDFGPADDSDPLTRVTPSTSTQGAATFTATDTTPRSVLDNAPPVLDAPPVATRRKNFEEPVTGPRAAPIKGKTIPVNDQGIIRRAAGLVGSQIDNYAAGVGFKAGDVLEAVGAERAGADLKKRAGALAERADTTSQSISLSADGAFEKYAPQILAVFPTMGVAAATGGLPVLFGISEVQAYAEGRKAGLAPEMALARAVPMATAEVVGEKLGGTGKLLNALETAVVKGGSLDSLKELSGKLASAGLREVPSEEATYVAQFGVDKAPGIGLRQDAGVADFLEGAKDTAIVAAGAGGVMDGAGAMMRGKAQPSAPIQSAEQMARARGFLRTDTPSTAPAASPALPPAPDPLDAKALAPIEAAPTVEAAIEAAQQSVSSAAVDTIARILELEKADASVPAAVPGAPAGAAGLGAADAGTGVAAGVGADAVAGPAMDTGGPGADPQALAAPVGAVPDAVTDVGAYRLNESGTLSVQGDPKALRQLLKQAGVTQVVGRADGVLVGRSQAQQAQQVLADFQAGAATPANNPVESAATPANTTGQDVGGFQVAGRDPRTVRFRHRKDGRLVRTITYADGETVTETLVTDKQGDETWVSDERYGKGEFYPVQFSDQAAAKRVEQERSETKDAIPTIATATPTVAGQSVPMENSRGEPANVWFGRRGDGYQALGDARMVAGQPAMVPVAEPVASSTPPAPPPVVAPAVAQPTESIGKTGGRGPAGGRTARSRAWDANPFRAFLGEHGISSALVKEFAPGLKERRGSMVQGYGPVFRKTDKQFDELAQLAVEQGFLPPGNPDPNALYDLVSKALRGERVVPLYAEGVAESEMEARLERQRQLEADALDLELTPEELADTGYAAASPEVRARVKELLAQAEQAGVNAEAVLEDVARMTENATEQDYYEAAEQALADAVARPGAAGARDRGQDSGQAGGQEEGLSGGGLREPPQAGRGEPAAGAEGVAPGALGRGDRPADAAGDLPASRPAGVRSADGPAADEGLTSPTPDEVVAQQDRRREGERAETQRKNDEAARAKADAERDEFTLTGSDRAADANPDQTSLLKRDGFTTGNRMSVAETRKIVDQLTAKWKDRPEIKVVATVLDLPGNPPSDVRGLYQRGKVWIVAGAHESGKGARQAIARTLAHEAVAHYGLRKMLGEGQWTQLMKNIQLGIKAGNKGLREIQDYVRRTYVDENEQPNLNPTLEADEIAARVVEQAIDADGNFRPGFGFVKAVYARIAQFLRNIGLDVAFSQSELQGILLRSLRAMEAGKRAEGGADILVAAARVEPLAARGDQARDGARWQSTQETEFGPEFIGRDIQLLPLVEKDTSTDLAENSLPLGHAAHVAPGNRVFGYAVVRDGAIVGTADLEVGADGQIAAVHDLDITERRAGTGRAVMEAILASARGPVRIIDIVPTAEAFWDKMGAGGLDAYANATADWSTYQAANPQPRGQEQGARADARADEGGPRGRNAPDQGTAEGFDEPVAARSPTARATAAPAPATPQAGPTSPWRDATGRLQFAPGAWLYEKLGDLAAPLLSKLSLKAASPELRRQLRQMKIAVAEAQEKAGAVATEAMKLSEAEREMVSDLIEQEMKAGTVPPQHAVRLAALINGAMNTQTDELVRLGMLSADSAEMWRDKYLPRFYQSKLKKQVGDAWADAIGRMMGRQKVMAGIKGKHLRGRGLYETIPVEQLADWQAMGWDVRDPDYSPESTEVQVWRDFTRQERDKMGEIRDAGFRFVMGYMQTQRDIALGRLFEGLANDAASSSKRETSEFTVRVPDGTVPGTGAKRYGKLAGRWVSKDTMSHLSQLEEAQSEAWRMYRKALGLWKEGKTALNPVSHANNILSNLTMAHFAGVSYLRADKYLAAAKDFATKADMVKEAKEAGLFLGTLTDAELMNTLPDDLKALVKQQDSAATKVGRSAFNVMTFFLRRPMGWAYQAEDTFFRYLIYKDARGRGLEPQDAVDYAQRYVFTYDDLPKGARMIRDFGLPFFGYTYKAVPALLHTALTHPVRMAAPAAILWGANAAAYAIGAGDDDENWETKLMRYLTDADFRKQVREKERLEREHLPPWMKGTTALGTPKAVRLGMDEVTKLPLFIDTARIIPGGDLFDVAPNAGGVPLPQPITPSHPLFTTAVAMLANKDLYFGKDLVDANDTRAEAAEKRLEWLWKQATPAIAAGNYHWERGLNALAQASGGEIKWLPESIADDYTGIGRDGLPVQPRLAAAQTFGIKIRPIDLDTAEKIEGNLKAKMLRDIDAEVKRLQRLNNKGAISDKLMERERDKAQVKKDRIRQGLTVDGDAKD